MTHLPAVPKKYLLTVHWGARAMIHSLKYTDLNIIYIYNIKYIYIPGSSFGRKKVPDLNPAKFSAGFRKNRRRPEKTSGSKILKNRDDKRLDHTQGNCLCAASRFCGAHSNLPVPIALAHLPNGLRAEPSQNISNLCPSKDFQEETKEHVAMNSSFSATVSLKCFFQSGLLSMILMLLNVSIKLASGRPPKKVAKLMVPVKTLI